MGNVKGAVHRDRSTKYNLTVFPLACRIVWSLCMQIVKKAHFHYMFTLLLHIFVNAYFVFLVFFFSLFLHACAQLSACIMRQFYILLFFFFSPCRNQSHLVWFKALNKWLRVGENSMV